MAQIPAFCPHCGAIFGSGIEVENARRLTMSGNKAQCPVCRELGDIPDGVFDVTDGVLEVLTAPAITSQRLERLRDILASVQQGATAPAEAVEAIGREAPELESFLARLTSPEMVPAWLTLLFAIISFLLGQQGDTTINIQHVTETVIQQCVQHPQAAAERRRSRP